LRRHPGLEFRAVADPCKMTNRVASAFAWEGSTKLFVQIISWISTIWVAKLLAPEDYGVVAISGLFTGVLALISEFGIGAGLITRRDVSEDEFRRCFWLGLIGSALLYALLFLAAPLIGRLYGIAELPAIIRVASLGLLISGLKIVPYSQVMRALNYRFRALTEMLGQFLQAISVIGFAMHGFGPWSLVYGYLIGQGTVAIVFFSRTASPWPMNASLHGLGDLVAFGTRITGARLLAFFVSSADMMIISATLGQRSAGLYSVSANLATAPLDKIGSIFNRVAFPLVARMQDEPERARALLAKFHFFLLACVSPALVGVALTSREVVPALLNSQWADAADILAILCISNVVRLSGMMLPSILEGLGRAEKVLAYQAFSATLLPLGFLVGSHWGLKGVAVSWLVVFPVIYTWLVISTTRALQMTVGALLGRVVPVILANLAMAAVVTVSRHLLVDYPLYWRLAWLIALGAITYLLSLVLLSAREQRQEAMGLLRSLRSLRARS
jgi:O-antigen/teichoic acid export membrane protein